MCDSQYRDIVSRVAYVCARDWQCVCQRANGRVRRASGSVCQPSEETNESSCVTKVQACQESVAASFRGERCHHPRCLDSVDYEVVRDRGVGV